MEIITKYPVLVNPLTEQKDQFRLSPNTKELEGTMQVVNTGDFTIKGATPVFEGDRQISRNDFIYRDQVTGGDNVLTPMDEYLYSERNISEGALGFGEFENWGDVFSNYDGPNKKDQRKIDREARRKAAREKANKTTPGNGEPSAADQDAKAKEGKFWDVLRGGYQNFLKSSSGQIILDSATNYIANKFGGATTNTGGGVVDDTPPADDKAKDEPMSKTTKYALIGGGVLLVGVILYSVLSKK
jgi:hypothetical protein